jgi:hypothetical protein
MDKLADLQYNVDNNVNDDANSEQVVEKIDKTKLENVTNPDCTHSRTKKAPADDEFDAPIDEIACLDCPMGWHIRREVTS